MLKEDLKINALTDDEIKWAIDFYENSPNKIFNESSYTYWIDLDKEPLMLDWLTDCFPFLQNKIVTAFIYTMTTGYLPHCDGTAQNQLQLNIPLKRTYSEDQYFIVFNQKTKVGPITWCDGKYPLVDEKVSGLNNLFYGPILPDQVEGHTMKYLDRDFYDKHLYRNPEIYWGLSPKIVFNQKPGDVLSFNPNRVHCTGKMPKDEEKLGIVVRYEQS